MDAQLAEKMAEIEDALASTLERDTHPEAIHNGSTALYAAGIARMRARVLRYLALHHRNPVFIPEG